MSRIPHIIKKEFGQIKRDRKMIGIMIIAPVLQLVLLGYAANLDVNEIPMVIYDRDKSSYSREFVAEFSNSGYFTLVEHVEEWDQVDMLIDSGRAAFALLVPKGFGKKIEVGGAAEVGVVIDGSESLQATAGLNYASMIASRFSNRVLVSRLSSSGADSPSQVVPEVRIWYNPDLKSRNFMVPGILGLLLMVVTLMLSSLAIVKEKEVGTMEQLIVTPIRPYELIIGKLVPFTIIAFVDVALVLLVSTIVFGIPVKGSLPLLFGLSGIFLLTTLGLGLLVSTISHNQQQAMMTAVFFVMMPMLLLSGFVFPIENMPPLIQLVTYLFPLRYYFIIIRGLFLKGVGLAELWDEALVMFLLGLGILAISVIRFRKKLD